MKSRKILEDIIGFGSIGLILAACNLSQRKEIDSITTPTTQTVNISSLTDGRYQICTEPLSQDKPDAYGWCFFFWKKGEKVTGWYTYWQPSDYTRICIEGTIDRDRVIGKGYETIEGWDKLITSADIAIDMSTEAKIWDDWNEEGKNLRMSRASLYKQGRDSNGYYAWIEYKKVELDSSGFYRRNLEKTAFSGNCVD